MKKIKLKCLIAVSILPLLAAAQQSDSIKKFKFNGLVAEAKNQKDRQPFLDNETMTDNVYFLRSGATDDRLADNFDEVYFIMSGNAELKSGNAVIPAETGSLIYVKAHTARNFFHIEKGLTVLALGSKAIPKEKDTAVAGYLLNEADRDRTNKEDGWHVFHNCGSLLFGLYMLPLALNGDSAQIHKVDEINIVTKGRGKFTVGTTTMDVEQGDIVYVRKNQPHWFHSLENDFDVLILFEKKSVQKK